VSCLILFDFDFLAEVSNGFAFLSIPLIKIISFVVSLKKIADLTLNYPPEILMPISELWTLT
jgi:hypothetical protein